MKPQETILIAIVLAFVFILIFMSAGSAFDRQEKMECYHWQQQAKMYSNFYLTKWQASQCLHWDVRVDAPVQ